MHSSGNKEELKKVNKQKTNTIQNRQMGEMQREKTQSLAQNADNEGPFKFGLLISLNSESILELFIT